MKKIVLKNITDYLIYFEIILFIPRIIFYVINELIPIRFIGLPFITLTLVFSIFLFLFSTLYSQKISKFSFVSLSILIIIIILDSINNPFREVIAETQGYIIFIIDYEIFRRFTKNGIKILKIILYTISVEVLILGTILIVNPLLLPSGASSGFRFEGFFTSSILLFLVPFSFIFFFNPQKDIKLGIFGILSSILLIVLTATKSTIFASIISILFITFFIIKQDRTQLIKALVVILIIIISGIFLIKTDNIFLKRNISITIERLNDFAQSKELIIDSYRLIERQHELKIFQDNPLFGEGFGLKKNYSFFGKDFFGHNFYTSLLARKGILGIFLLLIFILKLRLNIKQYLDSKNQFENKIWIALTSVFIVSILVLFYSNFIYYLALGIFGAIAGISESIFKNNTNENYNFNRQFLS